ncbi:cupin domain-containing protein [Ferrimonas sediminicola]|uniref:Cupin domain-containing protein n=1 Tax=Ferrimonas sediminicola TaxID=2569538 RepID=A0A4U1BD03_9GAMM|nr:cupin domain-containing protein [Ferrimonas sediminicola]TKB48903.1 cupin domain-containing protein [Ferrimonas sediminicola]
MYRLNLDTPHFLQHHWQKQPLFVKGAFTGFVDPLEPDELAGLASEESVSSRLVIQQGRQWRSEPGPVTDFERLGESDWQLLVQAVNHLEPAAAQLAASFRFLPDWRFDDLMASFAATGGGVGPHIDNYDVFIIQGQGRRRWQVGDRGEHKPRANSGALALVEDFEPIIDVEMAPGDLLYIPPGYPHCGQTLAPSLSYSVGFRAPSQQELLCQLADQLQQAGQGQRRFTSDSEPEPASLISGAHQQGLAQLMTELMTDPDTLRPMLGTLLSQNRFELDPLPPETPLDLRQLSSALDQGEELVRIGGLKVLHLEGDLPGSLYLDGQHWLLNTEALALPLREAPRLNGATLAPLLADRQDAETLLAFINLGYWYLE